VKFSSSAPSNAELLCLVISLLFHCSARVEEFAMNHTELLPEAEGLIENMWQQLHELVEKNWMVSYFSSKFGDPVGKKFQEASRDLQVQ
jgi:hypothetical protein